MIYDFTFANNVLFNWRHRTVDGGDHRSFYTIINNYFKPGPATPLDEPIALSPAQARVAPREAAGRRLRQGLRGRQHRRRQRARDGRQLGRRRADRVDRRTGDDPAEGAVRRAVSARVSRDSAGRRSLRIVLANAGATRPKRDAVDERDRQMVRTGQVAAQGRQEHGRKSSAQSVTRRT